MKTFKRILTTILAAGTLSSLCSCGETTAAHAASNDAKDTKATCCVLILLVKYIEYGVK